MNERDLEEFKSKIESICKEYEQFGGLLVIMNIEDDYHIAGNICMVCVRDTLTKAIVERGLQHTKHTMRTKQ